MKKNDIDIDDDMSKTFIAEVGQKSAIADDEEVLEENTNESNFPDISIEPPKEEINTNEIGTNIEENEVKSEYEKEPSMYDEPKKKKSNPLLTILLMILSLAIGIGGSYYYFKVLEKEEVSTKVEEKEEAKDTAEELKPDGVFVTELIKRYDYDAGASPMIYRNLYRNEKTEVTNIDETYIAITAAQDASDGWAPSFSSEELKQSIIKLYGIEIKYEDKDIKPDEHGGFQYYKYDSINKGYTFTEEVGGGEGGIYMERKIVKALKSENNIEVYVAPCLINPYNEVYKSMDKDGNESEKIDGVTSETFDIDKDYTKLNQYKYTFNYDSGNDNYYLVSIELVK